MDLRIDLRASRDRGLSRPLLFGLVVPALVRIDLRSSRGLLFGLVFPALLCMDLRSSRDRGLSRPFLGASWAN